MTLALESDRASAASSATPGHQSRRRVAATLAVGLVTGLTVFPLAGTSYARTDVVQSDESVTFTYTRTAQSFVVPPGIAELHVVATGGNGGAGYGAAVPGGSGSTLSLDLPVGPSAQVKSGDRLVVHVGGNGAPGQAGRPGDAGWNGGAWGGSVSAYHSGGGGGGGATDLRLPGGTLEDRVVVAAGGGGGGGTYSGGLGGAGGSGGQPGWDSTSGQRGGAAGSAGGQLGDGTTGGIGFAASGGGGGGGYYGGGGGEGSGAEFSGVFLAGGGGGGSNYVTPSAYDVGVEPVGDGTPEITISWVDAAPVISPHDDVHVTVGEGVTEVAVNYIKPTAEDAVDGSLPVTCAPAPGSMFPLGATTVTCSATDRQGNTGTGTFTVHVHGPVANEADLAIELTGPKRAARNSEVVYTATVTNHGPATADDLSAVLDVKGLRVTGTSSWTLASLASGESATFELTGTVKAKTGKRAQVVGLTFSDTDDPDRADNRAKLRTAVR